MQLVVVQLVQLDHALRGRHVARAVPQSVVVDASQIWIAHHDQNDPPDGDE